MPTWQYNEVIVGELDMEERLPRLIDAFLYVSDEPPSRTLIAYQAFLTAYGLDTDTVPLLIRMHGESYFLHV